MQKHGVFPKLYGIAGVLSYLIYCCFFTNHEHLHLGYHFRNLREGLQHPIKWKDGKLLGAYMERNNRKRGFTLVELIVVLVILAALAALLVPSLTGYIDKAKKKAVITEARDVWTASQAALSE